MLPLRGKAGSSAQTPTKQPSPSVPCPQPGSQHIYITNSARIHIIYILHQQKVGIGCRQRDRCPFQQHQSRSLSASVGLIADEKKARREIRFNTCMIDLHHLENGQICLRIYVLDTYTAGAAPARGLSSRLGCPANDRLFLSWKRPSIIVATTTDSATDTGLHISLIYIYIYNLISSACSDHLSVRAFFRFPPRSPPLRPFRAISYYTTNGFLHLSPSQSPIVAPMRAATEIKTPPTINTNLPAMVAMPTTARSNRIMVVGSTKQAKTTRDVMVRKTTNR